MRSEHNNNGSTDKYKPEQVQTFSSKHVFSSEQGLKHLAPKKNRGAIFFWRRPSNMGVLGGEAPQEKLGGLGGEAHQQNV